jgi:alpha-beta hydrolase superfamily lysophospholipase
MATTLRTLDGLHLAGTLVTPDGPPDRAIVPVHGGGVTREEGGFFTRLAAGLADAGVASLRFHLRGHGESEGSQAELTLSAIPNDMRLPVSSPSRGISSSRRPEARSADPQ